MVLELKVAAGPTVDKSSGNSKKVNKYQVYEIMKV